MRIVDRYFVKQFLQVILFAIFAFVIIFVIVDLMENLDDFIDQNVSNAKIFEYYLYFIPEIVRLVTPVSVFLASLFTVGKMANLNELTAIKVAGVSLYRIMLPFLITAFLVSLFSIYFGGYIVPLANKGKVAIEVNDMKKNIVYAGNNIFFQDSRNRIVNISFFDTQNNTGTKIGIQEYDRSDPTKMRSRIDAERMQYDSTHKVWHLYGGIKREFYNTEEIAERFDRKTLDYLNFSPKDVIQKQRKPEEMTLSELKSFYEEQARTGNDPTRTLIEYHSRYAYAMASFVVVFLGLPMAASKRRGGLALQFGISLLFTFVYLGFMKISQAFGKNGVMDPLLTAWFANLIFIAGAIINIFRIQK